eukprot:RCo044903
MGGATRADKPRKESKRRAAPQPQSLPSPVLLAGEETSVESQSASLPDTTPLAVLRQLLAQVGWSALSDAWGRLAAEAHETLQPSISTAAAKCPLPRSPTGSMAGAASAPLAALPTTPTRADRRKAPQGLVGYDSSLVVEEDTAPTPVLVSKRSDPASVGVVAEPEAEVERTVVSLRFASELRTGSLCERNSGEEDGLPPRVPLDLQGLLAEFCEGSVLWVLCQVSSALLRKICSSPPLCARLEERRLQRLWGSSTRAPVLVRSVYSPRLLALKDNLRDCVATEDGQLYVQVNDGRKWNAAKYGDKLDINAVVVRVSTDFAYATSSVWDYALAVGLTEDAPVVRRRTSLSAGAVSTSAAEDALCSVVEGGCTSSSPGRSGGGCGSSSTSVLTTAAFRCEFDPLEPSLSVFHSSGGQRCFRRLWAGGGRLEYISVEGAMCFAIVRSTTQPTELLAVDLNSGEASSFELPRSYTYAPKAVRALGGRRGWHLLVFELTAVSVLSPITPNGASGGSGGS